MQCISLINCKNSQLVISHFTHRVTGIISVQILWASKRLISSMDGLAAEVVLAKPASSQERLNYIIYFIVTIAVL